MKTCLRAAVGLIAFLALSGAAQAQYPGARPTVTPYLNLFRGGAPQGLNYYNLVRPELDFRSSIQQLQLQTGANQQAIADLTTPGALPVTGHQAGFMTHRTYFQTLGGGGAPAGTTAGFGTAPAATTAGFGTAPTATAAGFGTVGRGKTGR
jgi:hypothetical protein